jgi:hypothetical protein
VLTAEEVERFVADGFVYVPEAFPRALADEGRAFLWRETGLDPEDPGTWTQPVIRLGGYGSEPFRTGLARSPSGSRIPAIRATPGGTWRAATASRASRVTG